MANSQVMSVTNFRQTSRSAESVEALFTLEQQITP